jgi:hypothetical protein
MAPVGAGTGEERVAVPPEGDTVSLFLSKATVGAIDFGLIDMDALVARCPRRQRGSSAECWSPVKSVAVRSRGGQRALTNSSKSVYASTLELRGCRG